MSTRRITRTRKALATAFLAGQLLAMVGLGLTPAPSAGGFTPEAQARAVVSEFFRAINARQFGKACDLMSGRFYRKYHIPDRKHCMLGLTVGLGNGPTIFLRILGARSEGGRTLVSVTANGAPGEVVLVREARQWRVLELRAS